MFPKGGGFAYKWGGGGGGEKGSIGSSGAGVEGEGEGEGEGDGECGKFFPVVRHDSTEKEGPQEYHHTFHIHEDQAEHEGEERCGKQAGCG